jgi:hypothetical protein
MNLVLHLYGGRRGPWEGDSKFLRNFGMGKSPFKVCLGDKIFVPDTKKNPKSGLCRIQTESGTPLMIIGICFAVIKNGKMYCGIFAQSKNCGVTAAHKQERNAVSAQVMPMAAHTTVECIMPSLSNSCTATEERCFLHGPCWDVMRRTS